MARARLGKLPNLVSGRAKCALLRAPLVGQLSEARYRAELAERASRLPRIGPDTADFVDRLRRDCIVEADLKAKLPDEVIEAGCRFVTALKDSAAPDRVSPDEIAADRALFRWGLAHENLDLAEHYIGRQVRYLGVEVKRERVDGPATEARQWHMDVEDRRVLKVIVYLSDVDDGCGPFEYIDKNLSERAARRLRYRSGLVADTVMENVLPKEMWRRVIGPTLTAVYVDSANVFHRASPPTTTDRLDDLCLHEHEATSDLSRAHVVARQHPKDLPWTQLAPARGGRMRLANTSLSHE